MRIKKAAVLMLVFFAVCFVALSCGKDPTTPTEPDTPVTPTNCEDPENTIIVNLRNDGGTVTMLGCQLRINNANNFVCDDEHVTFVNVGEVSGLGCVEEVPEAGWSDQVAVIPGNGYIMAYSRCDYASYSLYEKKARVYIEKYLYSAGGGGILGAEIKYQDNWLNTTTLIGTTNYSYLRLNELNGNDKFIEIYNTGSNPVSLDGVYIEKDGEVNWEGDNTMAIPAGGFLLLYSESVASSHPEHPDGLFFHGGLSAKKNTRIQLFTPTGESIDDFNLINIELNGEVYGYPNNQAPASYSRNVNGKWYYADATPGVINVEGYDIVYGLEGGPIPGGPDYNNLLLNELNGDTKFIELYNRGDIDLPLDGLYIEKDDIEEPIWVSDNTIMVPAHDYVVLFSENVIADHPELEGTNYVFSRGLSSKKAVRFALFLADGTLLDIFTRCPIGGCWGESMSDVTPLSYARTPDGGDWKLADPTPGETNPPTGDDIPQE